MAPPVEGWQGYIARTANACQEVFAGVASHNAKKGPQRRANDCDNG